MSDTNCELCGGSGEVIITPYGAPDSQAAIYGCPMCIQADRDKAEQQRDELLAALKGVLVDFEGYHEKYEAAVVKARAAIA